MIAIILYKLILILKLLIGVISYPIYHIFFHKDYDSYSDWFNHHTYEIVGTSVGGIVGVSSITTSELESMLWLDIHDLIMVIFKTIGAVVVGYFVTKILKRWFPDIK